MSTHPKRWATACVALAAAMAPACDREPDQWLVSFTTNARLPQMGDHLHVEVLDANGRPACNDCVTDFTWDNDVQHELTVGVAGSDSAVRVRARLYRTVGGVRSSSVRSIDVVARLPGIDSGKTKVSFPVPVECFGRPPDVARGTSCRYDAAAGFVEGPEPTLGASPSLVNGPDGHECTKAPPEGMRCVGSGTMLMGDERVEALAFEYSARPEMIERVAPNAALMLDLDEVTVGTVRKLVRDGRITPGSGAGALHVRGEANSAEDACTYLGPDSATNDAMPVNCIGRELARSACAALGRRLPLEYEWEFAAGDGVNEVLYPWEAKDSLLVPIYETALGGIGLGLCENAIVARGREDREGESTTCRLGNRAGPVAGGSALDVTSAGIRNLAGNVAEWVDDEFALYEEDCWSRPLGGACRTSSKLLAGVRAPYRGGSWSSAAHAAMAVARFAQPDGAPSPAIGFRCAISEDQVP